MEKKLKIKELAEYYIKRYELSKYNTNTLKYYRDNEINTIKTEITRIIQDTKIGESDFWEIINPPKGARAVSVEEFEKQCFNKWADYIHKQFPSCKNNINFINDKKKNRIYDSENDYWEDRIESFREKNNSFYINGDIDTLNEELRNDYDDNIVLQEDVEKKAYGMMLKALYDVFYEPFKWDMLRYDLEHKPNDNGYNTDFSKEEVQAYDRLSDYKNYIGKMKIKK